MVAEEGKAWSVALQLVHESRRWVCNVHGVRPWVEFKDAYAEWLKSNPPTERAKEDFGEKLEVSRSLKLFLRFAAEKFLQPGEGIYSFRTNTIGQPDLFVRSATDGPLFVGIVDFDHPIQDAVRRLFTYMLVTGASFGVVVDGEFIRYAKIRRGDTLLSAPLSSWWALGFVLQLARDKPQQSIGDYSQGLAKLAPRDSHVVDSFKSIAIQHRSSSHARAIIHGMENLSFGDLEDVSCKWWGDTNSSVASAKYKQQPVVLKVRDLTTPWLLDVEMNLRKVITEVDAYKTLHKLQGLQIPHLVSWGFLCGTMFAYVMTSDEGRPLRSNLTFTVRDIQAALDPAYEALARIHARGLLHGDLTPRKIVLKRGSCSSPSSLVKIIGFSSASYIGPKETQAAVGREMAKLHQCFEEVLMFVQAEEDMAVDNFLLALRNSSWIVREFPKIRDLLNALGANLQGDDESSPKTDEAAEASDVLSPYFKEFMMVDALTTLVDNPKLLEEEPRFYELRRFLVERRQQSSSDGLTVSSV